MNRSRPPLAPPAHAFETSVAGEEDPGAALDSPDSAPAADPAAPASAERDRTPPPANPGADPPPAARRRRSR